MMQLALRLVMLYVFLWSQDPELRTVPGIAGFLISAAVPIFVERLNFLVAFLSLVSHVNGQVCALNDQSLPPSPCISY